MIEILQQKEEKILKYIVVKEKCEVIGFIELLSIGKFFRKKILNFYDESLTEPLKNDLDKLIYTINLLNDKYKEVQKQAVVENSYEPLEIFFKENGNILPYNHLYLWYHNKVYLPNINKLMDFTKSLKNNLVKANIDIDIEAMFNFFKYQYTENEVYNLYTHIFLTDHSKGESINELGGLLGFKFNQKEFMVSINDIDAQKSWSEERKNAIKKVIQFFPAPIILHEMTHYYYHKSGQLKKIEQNYAFEFKILNQEILKLNSKYILPSDKNNQAFSLLNEVLATSFQGVLQERIAYQDNSENKLYDSNDLVDQTAKSIIPMLNEYIKDKKQIDNKFILYFLKQAKKSCIELHKIDIANIKD